MECLLALVGYMHIVQLIERNNAYIHIHAYNYVYDSDLPRKLRRLGYIAAMEVLELSRWSINPNVPYNTIHAYISKQLVTFE